MGHCRLRRTSSLLNFLLSLLMHHILFSCFSNCDQESKTEESAYGKRAKKKVSWSSKNSRSKDSADILLQKNKKNVLTRCHSGLCTIPVEDDGEEKKLEKKQSVELMNDGMLLSDLPYIDADDQNYFTFNKYRMSRGIDRMNSNNNKKIILSKKETIRDHFEKRVKLVDAENFDSLKDSKSGTPASGKSLKSTSSVKSTDFLEIIEALQKNELELEEVKKNFCLKFIDVTKTTIPKMDNPFLIVENQQQNSNKPNTLIGMKNEKEGVIITTTVTESPNRVVTEVAKKFSNSWKEYELVSVRRTTSSNRILDADNNDGVRITKIPLPLSDDVDSLHIINSKSPDPDILEKTALAICNRKNSSMAVEFLTNLSHMLVDDCAAFHTAENSRNQTPVVEFKDFVLPVNISQLTNNKQQQQRRIPKFSSSKTDQASEFCCNLLAKDRDGLWELDPKAADGRQFLELDQLLNDLNDKRSKEAAAFAKEFFSSSESQGRIKEFSFPLEY